MHLPPTDRRKPREGSGETKFLFLCTLKVFIQTDPQLLLPFLESQSLIKWSSDYQVPSPICTEDLTCKRESVAFSFDSAHTEPMFSISMMRDYTIFVWLGLILFFMETTAVRNNLSPGRYKDSGTADAALIHAAECVAQCWDNSVYVTRCSKKTKCLCEDNLFQSVSGVLSNLRCLYGHCLVAIQTMLQCLYSQCQTAQFGSALHHALAICSPYGMDTVTNLPPLIRHQGLRKRQDQSSVFQGNQYSTYLSASVAHPLSRRSASVSASSAPRQTRNPFLGSTTTASQATPSSTFVGSNNIVTLTTVSQDMSAYPQPPEAEVMSQEA